MTFSLPRIPVRLKRIISRASSLLLLAQRSPIVQIILPEAKIASSAGLGEIVKFSIATYVGLGAYDTVSGASAVAQIAPSAGSSTVNATVGTALTFVYQYTGSDTPNHFQVVSAPPGLTQTNSKNSKTDSLSGIPTTAGSYNVKITAWRDSSNSGDGVSKTFTIIVDPGTPPTISSQPASVTINSGATTTLKVTAGGSVTGYQWYIGTSGTTGTPVSGATSASYTTPALTANRNYWVKVSNASGSTNSNTAAISVNQPPSFTTQPVSTTIASGGSATLSAVAGGTGPFTYQWFTVTSGVAEAIPGATEASYTTPALTASKTYQVRVTNMVTTKTSFNATVTVTQPPSFTTQPASVSIASGASAQFSVAVAGTGPFSYQWYEGQSGDTGSPISGATLSTYTTGALTATKSVWVKVSNTTTSTNSETATATVQSSSGYAAWKAAKSFAGGLNDDDDHDGLSNLLEYTLGLEPLVPNNGAAASLTTDNEFLILSYPLGPETTDVTPVFQRSGLNDSWINIPESDPTYVVTRTATQISVRIPRTNQSGFFRLSATLN